MNNHCLTIKNNLGAALVFVIFVVFLVAAISVSLLSDQARQLRQLENNRTTSHLLQYAYGVEAWAIEVLKRDREITQIDHLGEIWVRPLPPTDIDQHGNKVSGFIKDLSARFDLGRLTLNGLVDEVAVSQLKSILIGQQVEPGLADRLADWMDKDILPRAGGAESTHYTSLQPAYRTPNHSISSLDELVYVEGMDAKIISKLDPITTILPVRALYNLNTMPAELMVRLMPGLNLSVAQALVQSRRSAPWSSVDDFMKQLRNNTGMKAAAINKLRRIGLSVGSNFFRVTATVEYGDSIYQVRSDIFREPTGSMKIYQRSARLLQ